MTMVTHCLTYLINQVSPSIHGYILMNASTTSATITLHRCHGNNSVADNNSTYSNEISDNSAKNNDDNNTYRQNDDDGDIDNGDDDDDGDDDNDDDNDNDDNDDDDDDDDDDDNDDDDDEDTEDDDDCKYSDNRNIFCRNDTGNNGNNRIYVKKKGREVRYKKVNDVIQI